MSLRGVVSLHQQPFTLSFWSYNQCYSALQHRQLSGICGREAGGEHLPAVVAATCLAPLDREGRAGLDYLKGHSRVDREVSPQSGHVQEVPSTAPGLAALSRAREGGPPASSGQVRAFPVQPVPPEESSPSLRAPGRCTGNAAGLPDISDQAPL